MFKPPSAPSRERRLAVSTLVSLTILSLLLFLLHRPFPHALSQTLLLYAPNSLTRVEANVTLGIKTYVCDDSTEALVQNLVASVRSVYPRLRILLANDGPRTIAAMEGIKDDPFVEEMRLPSDSGISVGRNAMVNVTRTEYFALLDDDHLFDVDGGDMSLLIDALEDGFDIVGMRVRNLPGIPELEDESILIPRYVANITSFKGRTVTLCVWNENVGPSVIGMKHPLKVDVLHNALLARTETLRMVKWRDELKVNEHMTYFLDAKERGIRVGYLPSVFVHHRSRRPSRCYEKVRWREEEFERLLDYRDDFAWEKGCYFGFVEYAKQHMLAEKAASEDEYGQ